MTARNLVAPTLAAAVTAILSACGGDGGGGSAPADGSPGAKVFADANCGSCHKLAAAGSSGKVGADLDDKRPDTATIVRWVREGGQGMPAFQGQLTAAQIRDVSRYVAQVAGH